MSQQDGGPAFPSQIEAGPQGTFREVMAGGMSLRDWFAGQALTGIIAYSPPDSMVDGQIDARCAAGQAYRFADAMVRFRETS